MTVLDTIDRIVFHPITVLAALLGALGSMVQIPVLSAVVATVWSQAGVVFAAVSLFFSQGWLPQGTGQVLVTITAAVFAGRMLHKLWNGVERRLES